MARPKTVSRKDAIKRLIESHGLDFLQANNLIHGRQNIAEEDLQEITNRIVQVSKTPVKKFKRGKVRFRKVLEPEQESRPLYSETKNYIKTLHLGDQ